MGTSSNFRQHVQHGRRIPLPAVLPMLPTQILLNNFLYDLAQVTIPTDNVDDAFIRTPQRWNIGIIQRFHGGDRAYQLDLRLPHVWSTCCGCSAPPSLFQTGLVRRVARDADTRPFVIRTAGNPFRSGPSLPLALTTVLVVLIGVILPFTPWPLRSASCQLAGQVLRVPCGATTTYLILVELVNAD